ncbi:MAG: SIR2 family protein [Thermotogota bacterium]
MEVVELNQFQETLKDLIMYKNLVPIIGAGFTKGEKTGEENFVPDADDFKNIMINCIIRGSNYSSLKPELKEKTFNEVSNYFFNDSVVSEQDRKEILLLWFHDVKLLKHKKEFLSSMLWPYIYTFNIDDAIENNSNFRTILPYKEIDENVRNKGCVYKVHGDIWYEVSYKEESNLIFSEPQYVESLSKNKSMLTLLQTDYMENNLIFIGCSLKNEIDLMHAMSTGKTKYNEGAKRILVTSTRPTNKLEELDYEKYGINTILMVDNYDDFYQCVSDIKYSIKDKIKKLTLLDGFKINELTERDYNRDNLLRYFLTPEDGFFKHDSFTKPDFIINRELSNSIIKSIIDNPITIIKGKRFSGKSTLVLNLFERNKQKEFYYIPSSIKLDYNVIYELDKMTNSIIYFDSNVLDQELAFQLKKRSDEFANNNNSIVIACNNLEHDVSNTFSFLPYNKYFFELNNSFSDKEAKEFNDNISPKGIIKYNSNSSLLDFCYMLKETYPSYTSNLFDIDNITLQEAQLLIILTVFDKVYMPVCIALNISGKTWQDFISKYSPIIEIEEANYLEKEQHSRFKLTVNSKVWLKKIVKDYHARISRDHLLSNIKKIISTFQNHGQYQIIQRRVMMFDTLNEITGKGKTGSLKLILYIYENLSKELNNIPDYWLQKAKAIYKLENHKTENIMKGIDYAKKAYFDGERQRTVSNAEFTIALLYGKLCDLENFSNDKNIIQAIDWFHKAITNHQYNKDYVESMLDNYKRSKGVFSSFCKYLDNGTKNTKLLNQRNQIKEILEYSNTSF